MKNILLAMLFLLFVETLMAEQFDSAAVFKNAMQQYINRDIVGAIKSLDSIPKGDSRYEKAQAKIKEYKTKLPAEKKKENKLEPVKKQIPTEAPTTVTASEEVTNTEVKPALSPKIYLSGGLNYYIPTGDIASLITTGIGLEVEGQLRDFLSKDIIIGIAGSFNLYGGTVNTADSLSIIQLKLLPKYILKSFDKCDIYLNGGIGFAFEGLTVSTVNVGNTDFLWQIGVGFEIKPNGDVFIVIAEINYISIPQKSVASATRDGSFLNLNINMAFNLTK